MSSDKESIQFEITASHVHSPIRGAQVRVSKTFFVVASSLQSALKITLHYLQKVKEYDSPRITCIERKQVYSEVLTESNSMEYYTTD